MNLFGETEFRCQMADPPWPERGGGKIKRGADGHYPLIGTPGTDVSEPMAAAIRSMGWSPANDAHFWCWVTDNYLASGIALFPLLGFRYVRTFPWVKIATADHEGQEGVVLERSPYRQIALPKLRMGIGQYARGCHELLLFGVRGRGQAPEVWTGARDVRSVLMAPQDPTRIHSRKPADSYALIESVSKGPRIEYFARVARPGWTARGNEAA